MNASRVIAAFFLALSSNFLFPMITMETGLDNDDGSYICYRKTVSQGHSLLYFNFEDKGLFRTCMEVFDASNPMPTLQVLEEGFGKSREFWNAAREYESQNQNEKNESKQNSNSNDVASKGERLAIEWYCDPKGSCQAREYYQLLDDAQQNKFNNLFAELVAGAKPDKKRFRNEGDNIYALKAIPDRLLCFFTDNAKIIITNAFEKRTDKLSSAEKELAVKGRLDYLARCKAGMYYKK